MKRTAYQVVGLMCAFAGHDAWHAKYYGWMALNLIMASTCFALYESALRRHITATPTEDTV